MMGRYGNIRWEEERDRVQGSVDSNGDQHVDVDLPVFEGIHGVLQIKLIGEVSSVMLETSFDFHALFIGQERCSVLN